MQTHNWLILHWRHERLLHRHRAVVLLGLAIRHRHRHLLIVRRRLALIHLRLARIHLRRALAHLRLAWLGIKLILRRITGRCELLETPVRILRIALHRRLRRHSVHLRLRLVRVVTVRRLLVGLTLNHQK